MSTGQTGANGHFKAMRRTSLCLTKKDWCEYTGVCYEDLNSDNLCKHCKYKKLFDIPKMLEDRK